MIHECLLNLWNNPDSEDVSESENWSKLIELKEFLHPGELKLLQTIVEIGVKYHQINNFIKTVLNQPLLQGDNSSTTLAQDYHGGMYITAFCNGVHTVLNVYRTEILNLEGMFLQNPQLSLTFILCKIEKYRTLFYALLSMIQTLKDENLHGCLLMGRLHNYLNSGVDQINLATFEIIKSINTVFFRYLCNWIIYGDLNDDYNEFFIKDCKCPDENFLYPEQILELDSSTCTSINLQKKKIRRPPMVQKFIINYEMVPSFISENLAENILFMGRIVWIIRNDPRKNDDFEIACEPDIWGGKDVEFYQKVQALESKPFNNVVFTQAIHESKVQLNKYLWSVMLDEGNLITHLRLIREYYALGRGELFQQFIRVADEHIKDTSSDLIVKNLNNIFIETARNIYGENDKSYLKFELSTSTKVTSANKWSILQLNFNIDWPLHIVFHPKVIELYNKLFCYLLRLRKTQLYLHKLWAEQIASKLRIDTKVWTLRQKLMFLVNNLHYYLQVDVIEAHFSILMKAVESANGFEDIIKVHHEFISSLLAKTFISTLDEDVTYKSKHELYQVPAVHSDKSNKVNVIINELLELCDKFCLVSASWGSELTDVEREELNECQNQCNLVIKTLLIVLQKLHEKAKGQHLLQLISQLDFNRHFSKINID